MKQTLLSLAALLAFAIPASAQDLILTGIFDGPLTGGTPKGIELYVVNDVADLSVYSVNNANNGTPFSASPFALSGAATAGTFLYVASEAPQFTNFFGFAPNFTSSTMNINGDDVVGLFESGTLVDVYGVLGVDGTGEVWEHLDGWGYRVDGTTASDTFSASDWTFSGVNGLEGGTTNATVDTPFPIGTYAPGGAGGTSVTTSNAIGWRLLSVPTPLTVDDLAQINLVSGAGGYTTGTNCAVNAITNLFTEYTGDETGTNGGYVAPGPGAIIEPGAGFFWYFFGDTPTAGQPSSCTDGTSTSTTKMLPITLNADGTSSFGSPQVTISDANDADGFYMLGNPYGSAFDISAISAVQAGTATPVDLQAGVQLWDPVDQMYEVYTADGADDMSDADTDDVSIWQGFFVERSGADPGTDVTFDFDFSGILSGVTGDGFIGRFAADTAPKVSFRVTDGTVTGAAAIVRFEETADAGWDRFDLSKLSPFSSDFVQFGPVGLDREGEMVVKAVESRALSTGAVSVPFSFTTSQDAGEFTITWPTFVLADGQTAQLTDTVTGQTVDLATAGELTFTHDASAPAERFEFTTSIVVADEAGAAESITLSPISPNPTRGDARMTLSLAQSEAVTVQVYDALGRRVATVLDAVVSAGARVVSVPTAALAPGVYVVRVTGDSFAETRRLTVTR